MGFARLPSTEVPACVGDDHGDIGAPFAFAPPRQSAGITAATGRHLRSFAFSKAYTDLHFDRDSDPERPGGRMDATARSCQDEQDANSRHPSESFFQCASVSRFYHFLVGTGAFRNQSPD